MGLYLEDVGGTVEEKLINLRELAYYVGHGVGKVDGLDNHKKMVEIGKRYICLVDNGAFQVIGVAYDQRELDHFNREDDKRMKIWYQMDLGTIKKYAPNWSSYKKRLQ